MRGKLFGLAAALAICIGLASGSTRAAGYEPPTGTGIQTDFAATPGQEPSSNPARRKVTGRAFVDTRVATIGGGSDETMLQYLAKQLGF